MKKAIIFLVIMGLTVGLKGIDETYYQKMGESLALFAQSTSVSDYQQLANRFATISKVNPDEWLPIYYEAQCYILMSFAETTGPTNQDDHLDVAKTAMDKILVMAAEESEVHALNALYHTARLVVNPMERAQFTAPLVNGAIAKSLSLDPNNPRAKYIRLTNEIGTAQFFGEDTSPYCNTALELLSTWDSFQLKSPIHPVWGKNMVQQIVDSCGE